MVDLITQVLRQFGEVKVRVTGSSMLPLLWPGDVLTVRSCTMSEARPGDCVLFARDQRLFAHRVISHHGTSLTTQGEAVPQPDPPVREAELLGTVVSVLRGSRQTGVPPHLSWSGRIIAGLVCRSSRVGKVLQRAYAVHRRSFRRAET